MIDDGYSKVARYTWTDARFRGLSGPAPNAQTLWLYLLSGRRSMSLPGLLHVGILGLAEDLGWPVEDTTRCLREIVNAEMATFDADAPLLWLPKAIRHNMPKDPGVVLTWGSAWRALPECALRAEATEALLRRFRMTDEQNDVAADGIGLAAAFEAAIGRRTMKLASVRSVQSYPLPEVPRVDVALGTEMPLPAAPIPPAVTTSRSADLAPPEVAFTHVVSGQVKSTVGAVDGTKIALVIYNVWAMSPAMMAIDEACRAEDPSLLEYGARWLAERVLAKQLSEHVVERFAREIASRYETNAQAQIPLPNKAKFGAYLNAMLRSPIAEVPTPSTAIKDLAPNVPASNPPLVSSRSSEKIPAPPGETWTSFLRRLADENHPYALRIQARIDGGTSPSMVFSNPVRKVLLEIDQQHPPVGTTPTPGVRRSIRSSGTAMQPAAKPGEYDWMSQPQKEV